MILYCGCEGTQQTAGFQDELYGKGNRVHNRLGPKTNQCACTICLKKRDVPARDANGSNIGAND